MKFSSKMSKKRQRLKKITAGTEDVPPREKMGETIRMIKSNKTPEDNITLEIIASGEDKLEEAH